MTDPDLKYLLRKPGTIPQIGPETGRPVTDGIAVFRSPQGSWRFVYLEGGKALSALQVMDLGGGRAQTKHVYTLPAHRHRGLAAKLLAEVRMKWVDVTNSIAQVGRNVRRKARKIKEESTNLLQDIQNAWVRRSWSEEGDPFHLEHLEHILAPKGEAWGIGPETGKTLKNGISVYRSVGDDPYRSWRFVLSEKGHPVSALQIIERSKTRATISTVFTAPSHRRRGLAEKLLKRARKQFKRVEHSSLRSPAGNAWASAVGLMPGGVGEDYPEVGRAKQKRKIQSVLVSKEEAPRLQSAQRIVRELGLKTKKVDETEANWRFRQHPPEKFQKGTFQTWHLGLPEGVKEIAAIPRRGAKVAGDDLEERRRKNQERAAKQRAAEKESPAAAKGRAVLEEFERRRRQNTSPSRYPLHVVEDDEKDDIGAVQLWEGGGLLQLPYIGAKKKKGSRVGATEDPALLLDNLDPVALNVAQLTPGFRVDYCLSLLPHKEKMRFVIWCAEQAWRLYIRNSLPTELDPRSRNQMEALWRYQDGKLSQQEVGRYLWEGIYPQANRDTIMAINYAIAEAASPQGPYAEFVARHTSNAMILAANPRATDEEQFNSTREEIMERLRQSLREAYATATEMAREHYYPAFSGAWPTVVEATLLRERARQRLLEIIHGGNSSYMAKLDGTLTDVGIKKAELALAQLAEVTDAQSILAETYHRYRGGKSSKRLWAQAVRYLYGDKKKILSEWNSIKFKFKS